MLPDYFCKKNLFWLQYFSLVYELFFVPINELVLGALFAVKNDEGGPYEWQLNLHNSMWPLKVLLLLCLMALTFLLLPDIFYQYYAFLQVIVCEN